MTARAFPVISMCAVALAVLSGCESSQDKSARLAKQGGKAFTRKGLDVKHLNANVKVIGATVLQDRNGAATVVELRNASATPVVNVPVAIDVEGAGHRSVFKNDAPGLETSLVSAPLIQPRAEFDWVNDQVTPAGVARSVAARVGTSSVRPPDRIPEVGVGTAQLKDDPVSGMEATGAVTNRSKVEQRKLVVYVVARRGGKVVAAGRGAIERLRPGQRLFYHVFFIGDPRGARLSVTAPPTVLQ